jgi:Zn-dependent protease
MSRRGARNREIDSGFMRVLLSPLLHTTTGGTIIVGSMDPGEIAINFAVFLFSLSVHECAHAVAAEYSGDPTSRYLGRITLNPMAHIDPFGTVIFPLFGMIFAGGVFFGWAKPVPFNPMNLRNRKLGEIVIAVAGPASNLLLVVVCAVLMKFLFGGNRLPFGDMSDAIYHILRVGIIWNISLAVFNMLPVPPLDGSHVLRNLLPDSLADLYSEINPMIGFVILIALVQIGVTAWISAPIYVLLNQFLNS